MLLYLLGHEDQWLLLGLNVFGWVLAAIPFAFGLIVIVNGTNEKDREEIKGGWLLLALAAVVGFLGGYLVAAALVLVIFYVLWKIVESVVILSRKR